MSCGNYVTFNVNFQQAIIEVDCIYKTTRGTVTEMIRVDGVSTHMNSCLSVVQIQTRYIFFLSSTTEYVHFIFGFL